jgi:hypothetical protein
VWKMRSETFAARNAVAVTKLLSGKYFADIFVSGGLASATEDGVPHQAEAICSSLSFRVMAMSPFLVPKALNGAGAGVGAT